MVNGTRAIVTHITPVCVTMCVSRARALAPRDAPHLLRRPLLLPRSRRIGHNTDFYIPRIIFEMTKGGIKFVRRQFPIRLAYAGTVHKNQGQTRRFALIDISTKQCFEHGQGYVGPSRVGASARCAYLLSELPKAGERATFLNVVIQELMVAGKLTPRQVQVQQGEAEAEDSNPDSSSTSGSDGEAPSRPRRRDAQNVGERRQRDRAATRMTGYLGRQQSREELFAAAQRHMGADPDIAAATAAANLERDASRRARVEGMYRAVLIATGRAADGIDDLLRAVLETRRAPRAAGALRYHTTAALPNAATYSWFYNPLAYAAVGYSGGDIDTVRALAGPIFDEAVDAYRADFAARGITEVDFRTQGNLYLHAAYQNRLFDTATAANPAGSTVPIAFHNRVFKWARDAHEAAVASDNAHFAALRAAPRAQPSLFEATLRRLQSGGGAIQ